MKPTIGIIAGSGVLPITLASHLADKKQPVVVLALKGHANKALFPTNVLVKEVRLGAVGKSFKLLKKYGVNQLVFIGGVRRPSWAEIRPDFKGLSLLAKLSLKALGDDGLLRYVIKEVESQGFMVKGIHEIMPELLVPEGVLTTKKPLKKDVLDIERGYEVAKLLGQADVGQAVIVQQGLVLSLEGIEGTAALIERTKKLKRKGGGGVLVKVIKPQQEKRVDMPTIGPNTVQSIYDAGLKGIAVEADSVLLAEAEKTIALADKLNIFIVGIKKV
ncbi:MAG: UDP-2,3-diacylglucosamine diphosphatase LpxI [Alphaproteobacteria bacterium]|nr:UDP-2,3-diacylglucosamine diphosphatase LpxI [Alphaproteobacteria bacterium]